jgi:rubrerythrin
MWAQCGHELCKEEIMADLSPEVVEAIKMAIQLEKDGQAFFKAAAAKTSNSLGKKMFEKLASDEINHLKTFQEMFDSLTGGKDWRHVVQGYSPAKHPPLFVTDDTPKSRAEKSEGEVEALRDAMEVERKAIDFFSEAAENAGDSMARQIFERIKEEEVLHYDLLQAQYDSVTNSGFWFDIQEFQMDGKF